MANEDLLKPLKAINKTIARLREDVQTLTGEVKKITTVIQEAAESIRGAIQENIQAQAEFKLMEHVMEVRSIKPQIEAEYEQIRTERAELDERLQSIQKRYQRRHEELDEKARKRIRNLGSHIFEIDEQQFEDGIEDPFTEQVTTAWQSLRAHNEDLREERSDRVCETTGDVVNTIQEFIHRQNELIESIQNHRIDTDEVPITGKQTERLQVPYYVVEYEAGGVAHRDVIVPSQLTTDGGTDWCTVSLSPISGAEELIGGVTPNANTGNKDWLTEDDLVSVLGEYGTSSPLGVSYAEAVAETTPDDGLVPVRTTGGED